MIKYFLNEKEIRVLNGSSFAIKKDETLDSGKIELIFSDLKEPIKPMSQVRIQDKETNYCFLIVKDIVEVATKHPISYKHTCAFVQNTRKLSKIQVRNTQFSQPAQNELSCYLNGSFINDIANITDGYMLSFGSNSKRNVYLNSEFEITGKHNVRNLVFEIDIKHLSYSYDEETHSREYTEQTTCPSLQISFSIKNKTTGSVAKYISQSFNSGDRLLINAKLSQGVYTISDFGIKKIDSAYNNDIFVVNATLTCEVYYYTLYDVLDILRKQVALEETGITTTGLLMPKLSLKKLYVEELKKYNIIGVIYNPNKIDCIVHWTINGSGDFQYKSFTSEIGAYETKELVVINASVGYVQANAYLTDTSNVLKSDTTSARIEFSNVILEPTITFVKDGTGYKVSIENPNDEPTILFYKIWETTDTEPDEFTSEKEFGSKEVFTSGTYYQTRIKVKAYLVRADNEVLVSKVVEAYKAIPPLFYDYDLYESNDGEDGEYTLISSDQFQSDTDYTSVDTLYQEFVENNKIDEIYKLNKEKSSYDGSHFSMYVYRNKMKLTEPLIYNESSLTDYDYYYYKVRNSNSVNVVLYVNYRNVGSVEPSGEIHLSGKWEKGKTSVDLVGYFKDLNNNYFDSEKATLTIQRPTTKTLIKPYLYDNGSDLTTLKVSVRNSNGVSVSVIGELMSGSTILSQYAYGDLVIGANQSANLNDFIWDNAGEGTTNLTYNLKFQATEDATYGDSDYEEKTFYKTYTLTIAYKGCNKGNEYKYIEVNTMVNPNDYGVAPSGYAITSRSPSYSFKMDKDKTLTITCEKLVAEEPTKVNCPCTTYLDIDQSGESGRVNVRIKNGTNIARTITITSLDCANKELELNDTSQVVEPGQYFEAYSNKTTSVSDYNRETIVNYKVDSYEFEYRYSKGTYYDLTIHYVGVDKADEVVAIASGSLVEVDKYGVAPSGYLITSRTPSSDFYMTGDASIQVFVTKLTTFSLSVGDACSNEKCTSLVVGNGQNYCEYTVALGGEETCCKNETSACVAVQGCPYIFTTISWNNLITIDNVNYVLVSSSGKGTSRVSASYIAQGE